MAKLTAAEVLKNLYVAGGESPLQLRKRLIDSQEHGLEVAVWEISGVEAGDYPVFREGQFRSRIFWENKEDLKSPDETPADYVKRFIRDYSAPLERRGKVYVCSTDGASWGFLVKEFRKRAGLYLSFDLKGIRTAEETVEITEDAVHSAAGSVEMSDVYGSLGVKEGITELEYSGWGWVRDILRSWHKVEDRPSVLDSPDFVRFE